VAKPDYLKWMVGTLLVLVLGATGLGIDAFGEMGDALGDMNDTVTAIRDERVQTENRMTTLEADHFGVSDALELWKAIGAIREDIHKQPPQPWLIQRLDSQDKKLDKISDDVSRLSGEVTALKLRL
jgi:hypothetical protein